MSIEKDKYFFHIIIPNWNCGNFLRRALDSILNQKFLDYCITIIDDKSDDDSRIIIKEYAQKYSNIEYFFPEEKVFGGGARNIGITQTKFDSEYTLFVDSDDNYYDSYALNDLLIKLQSNNFETEFLKFGYYTNGTRNCGTNINSMPTVWSVCIKTDKLKLFKENRYKYNDVVWYILTLDNCDKIQTLNLPIYQYHVRENPYSVQYGKIGNDKEKTKIAKQQLVDDLKSLTDIKHDNVKTIIKKYITIYDKK